MTPVSIVVSRADLSSRIVPTAPAGFDDTRSEYIERHLEALLPDVRVVEAFHRGLVAYLGQPDVLHHVRRVAGLTLGVPETTRDGAILVPGDNAPAWFWHAVLFNEIALDVAWIAAFVEATPFRMFDAPSRKQTLNKQGWYAAHVLDVRDGDTAWRNWPTTSAVSRFVRNVHPCNVFYVPKEPKKAWVRVSGDASMIASVAAYYRERYSSVWEEFCQLAAAPTGHGDPAPDGLLEVRREPSPSVSPVTSRTSTAPTRAVSAGGGAAPGWAEILQPGEPTTTGALLSRDPDAVSLTRRLLEGLTVERLIAIADAMFNRCRVRDMEVAAPGDPLRQASLAWTALFAGANKKHTRPTGWTGAARLLAIGQVEGLAAVSILDIGAVARVGSRIVAEPYAWANAHGLR